MPIGKFKIGDNDTDQFFFSGGDFNFTFAGHDNHDHFDHHTFFASGRTAIFRLFKAPSMPRTTAIPYWSPPAPIPNRSWSMAKII